MLREKHERRLDDESIKPLASYRDEELERMKVNFFGPDPAYHEARRRFVFKGAPPPRRNRAPVSGRVEPSQGAPRPMREDVSWFAPFRGVNGSAHAPQLEPEERSALTGGAWGARVLGMLRRKVAAVQPRRNQ
jgi:hypothetical protein